MNNKFLNIKKGSWLFLFFLQCGLLFGQKTIISFRQTDFPTIIKTIEDQSTFICNYDPSLLNAYTFTGKLDVSHPQNCMEKILYDSPFDFEVNSKTILIFKPPPTNFKICGTVQDALTHAPLLYANVLANNTNLGIQTDEQGYFETTINGYKNQRITISYIGYQPVVYQVQELKSEDCKTINLSIDKHLWKEEIIVTDYILDGISEGQAYSGHQLNYHQLAKYHSIVEHDILKTAQLLPGITSLDESATNLQIRGNALDQNLILWEGVPLYQSGHLFGMISAVNPFSVNEVNVFKGVYDPKYDNRVGGIIDISLTDSIQSAPHGSAGLTLTEAHLNLATPLVKDKISVLLSGRYSLNALLNTPALQSYTDKVLQFSKIDDLSEEVAEGGFNANQALNFYDWNAKILYQPTNRLFMTIGIYQNNQDFQYDLSSPNDPFQTSDKITNHSEAIHTNLDWEVSQKWTTSLSFVQSKYVNEFEYQEEENGLSLKNYFQFNDILDQSISLSNTYQLTSPFTFNWGYDYNIKQVNYDLINESTYEPDFEEKNFERASFHNFFLSTKLLRQKYSLHGGLRVTYYEQEKKWVSAPRLNFQYVIHSQLKLKVEGGIFHQFISQLRDFGSNAIVANNPLWIINRSDANLSQQAKKIATGFIYQNGGLLIDVEGYYNNLDGLSTLSPLFSLVGEEPSFSRGNSTAIGIDLLVKQRWNNFNTWVNYSLGKITYLFPTIEENSFFAPNDIRHNLSLVGSYTYKDLQMTLNGSYRSGLPFTRPLGISNFFDEDESVTIYYVDYSEINNDRLRPYFRMDLSVNYRPSFKKMKNLKTEFSLSILNLLNRNNVSAREYYLDFEEELTPPKLAFIQKALLKTTPLILVRVHW